MSDHHLILGKLTDYISADTLDDTLDERYRQDIGRLLVQQKGFQKEQIMPRYELEIRVENKCAQLLITYVVKHQSRFAMLIQFGPGSLITRHRPALAMARLVTDYQIPVVVVTNGEQADILNGCNGDYIDKGLKNIPDYNELTAIIQQHHWTVIGQERVRMESRILMAFEVDGRCPCDDSICTIAANH